MKGRLFVAKLKDLLPDLSELNKSQHKIRSITQVQITEKDYESDKILNMKIKNPETGNDIKLKSALAYPEDTAVHKAAVTAHEKAMAIVNKTKGDTEKRKPLKKGETSPHGAKQPGIGAGAKNLTGPKDDADSVSGSAAADRKVIDTIRAMGKDDDPDLCTVQVPGTNLFCQKNKKIPRDRMPQLKSKPAPGSPVEKLVKAGKLKQDDSTGEVNTEPLFKKMLEKEGIETKDPEPRNVGDLKATQNQLVGKKVKMYAEVLAWQSDGNSDSTVDSEGNENPPGPDGKPNTNKRMQGWQDALREPILVSSDGYILDGHHRWAALVQHDMVNGGGGDIEMDVKEIDMGAEDLVDRTNKFTNDMGLEVKAAKKKEKNERMISFRDIIDEILAVRL